MKFTLSQLLGLEPMPKLPDGKVTTFINRKKYSSKSSNIYSKQVRPGCCSLMMTHSRSI
jgi:hypothetical protein